jgi:hypothetical protein
MKSWRTIVVSEGDAVLRNEYHIRFRCCGPIVIATGPIGKPRHFGNGVYAEAMAALVPSKIPAGGAVLYRCGGYPDLQIAHACALDYACVGVRFAGDDLTHNWRRIKRESTMTIAEILEQAKALTLQEQKSLPNCRIDLTDVEPAITPRRWLELRGAGKDIWHGIDGQEYVDQMRDEWDERP